MSENTEKKKYSRPQLISLGKISELEQNNQISGEMREYLTSLRGILAESSAQSNQQISSNENKG